MPTGVPAKLIGACLALAALAISIIAGLASGNPTDAILSAGLMWMLFAFPVGWIIGFAGEKVVREAIERASIEPATVHSQAVEAVPAAAAGGSYDQKPTSNPQSARAT